MKNQVIKYNLSIVIPVQILCEKNGKVNIKKLDEDIAEYRDNFEKVVEQSLYNQESFEGSWSIGIIQVVENDKSKAAK